MMRKAQIWVRRSYIILASTDAPDKHSASHYEPSNSLGGVKNRQMTGRQTIRSNV